MATSLGNRVRAWNSPLVGGALFLEADFRSQRFDPHFHEEFAIGVISGGCQAFSYDRGRRLDMPKGTVALIAPGVVHEGWPGMEDGWRYRMLYPSARSVTGVAWDIFGEGALGNIHRPVVSDPRLYALLTHLHQLCGQRTASTMAVETIFLSIVRIIFESHAGLSPPSKSGVVDPFGTAAMRDMIEARYAEPITLGELASVVGASRFQALRRFKARFGLPPHAYLRQMRVQRALKLIVCGKALADAAVATGFADQPHMTRAFRRILGFTPGAIAGRQPVVCNSELAGIETPQIS